MIPSSQSPAFGLPSHRFVPSAGLFTRFPVPLLAVIVMLAGCASPEWLRARDECRQHALPSFPVRLQDTVVRKSEVVQVPDGGTSCVTRTVPGPHVMGRPTTETRTDCAPSTRAETRWYDQVVALDVNERAREDYVAACTRNVCDQRYGNGECSVPEGMKGVARAASFPPAAVVPNASMVPPPSGASMPTGGVPPVAVQTPWTAMPPPPPSSPSLPLSSPQVSSALNAQALAAQTHVAQVAAAQAAAAQARREHEERLRAARLLRDKASAVASSISGSPVGQVPRALTPVAPQSISIQTNVVQSNVVQSSGLQSSVIQSTTSQATAIQSVSRPSGPQAAAIQSSASPSSAPPSSTAQSGAAASGSTPVRSSPPANPSTSAQASELAQARETLVRYFGAAWLANPTGHVLSSLAQRCEANLPLPLDRIGTVRLNAQGGIVVAGRIDSRQSGAPCLVLHEVKGAFTQADVDRIKVALSKLGTTVQ